LGSCGFDCCQLEFSEKVEGEFVCILLRPVVLPIHTSAPKVMVELVKDNEGVAENIAVQDAYGLVFRIISTVSGSDMPLWQAHLKIWNCNAISLRQLL